MRQIENPHQPEYDGEPRGDEKQERTGGQPVEKLEHPESQIHDLPNAASGGGHHKDRPRCVFGLPNGAAPQPILLSVLRRKYLVLALRRDGATSQDQAL